DSAGPTTCELQNKVSGQSSMSHRNMVQMGRLRRLFPPCPFRTCNNPPDLSSADPPLDPSSRMSYVGSPASLAIACPVGAYHEYSVLADRACGVAGLVRAGWTIARAGKRG